MIEHILRQAGIAGVDVDDEDASTWRNDPLPVVKNAYLQRSGESRVSQTDRRRPCMSRDRGRGANFDFV